MKPNSGSMEKLKNGLYGLPVTDVAISLYRLKGSSLLSKGLVLLFEGFKIGDLIASYSISTGGIDPLRAIATAIFLFEYMGISWCQKKLTDRVLEIDSGKKLYRPGEIL